jgi:hypothetical protein
MSYREQDKDALITKLREEVSFLTSKNNSQIVAKQSHHTIQSVPLYFIAVIMVFASTAMGIVTFLFVVAQGLARHTNGKNILITLFCLACTVGFMKLAYWLNDKSRS